MNNAQLARLLRCADRKLQLEALTLFGSNILPLDVTQQLRRRPPIANPTSKWDFRDPVNGYKCLTAPEGQFELWDAVVFPDQPRVSCVWRFLRWLYHQKVSDHATLQVDPVELFHRINKDTDTTKFTREFLQVVREDVLASFTLLDEENSKLLARTALIRCGKMQHIDEKKELDWTLGPSLTAKSIWFVWMFTDWHKRRTGEDWTKHYYIPWREIGTETAHDRLLTTRTLDLKARRPLVVHVGDNAWMVHDHLRGSFLCDNSATAIAVWNKLNSFY